jgi:enoyl-[acyl-carrier-protein] reductase (NADH)
MLKHYQERAPLGRSCDPAEIGQTGLFLASDGAAFVNGQVLVLDGGQLAGQKASAELLARLNPELPHVQS